jgi:uncharacterized protein (TIGR01777 family)
MKILISGSHGLVGQALSRSLAFDGHTVLRLVRKTATNENEILWRPDSGVVDSSSLEGLDGVVHLAGESIASGRWTDDKKQRIFDSRVKGTFALSKALAQLNEPPKSFLCASAIGYYGDRKEEVLTESSAPGNDFLATLCVQWEKATGPAVEKGIRTLCTRFGIILDKKGGALAKMLTPFRMGIGGRVGEGKQWMSWIALDDVVSALRFVMNKTELSGPVNFVAPNPVTNEAFTRALGRTLGKPSLIPIPEFGVRLAFGEMADALLLSSQRVEPTKLNNAQFEFRLTTIDEALRRILV